MYYHEYIVPWRTLQYVIPHFWGMKLNNISFRGFNLRKYKTLPTVNIENTLLISSVDFSHFLPMKEALPMENCAAHSLMQNYLNVYCSKVIDHKDTIKAMYKILPNKWITQWVGRTRSPGKKGVGYLSFLIREPPTPKNNRPDGIFITSYDRKMKAKECLGEWYSKNKIWTKESEKALADKVIYLGNTTGRLTGGRDLETPISHYTVTYLYKDDKNDFIRGWHGIKHNAFYLPDVMLENTFNNGEWITNETSWPKGVRFHMDPTLKKLTHKAGLIEEYNKYHTKFFTLYSSTETHHKI